MESKKISVSLSHDEWMAVIGALAVGISSNAELIKDLSSPDNVFAEPEYLIKSYMDEVNRMRDAKAEIWRRLIE